MEKILYKKDAFERGNVSEIENVFKSIPWLNEFYRIEADSEGNSHHFLIFNTELDASNETFGYITLCVDDIRVIKENEHNLWIMLKVGMVVFNKPTETSGNVSFLTFRIHVDGVSCRSNVQKRRDLI